jgi:hypothetical protein
MSAIGMAQPNTLADLDELSDEALAGILRGHLDIVHPRHLGQVAAAIDNGEYDTALGMAASDFADQLRSLPDDLLGKFCALFCADKDAFWLNADGVVQFMSLVGATAGVVALGPLGALIGLAGRSVSFLLYLLKRFKLMEELCGC